jgi:hypothetical protein
MANITRALKELQEQRSVTARKLKTLDEAISVLGKISGRHGRALVVSLKARARRPLSAKARRRIAAAQRARWAKWRARQAKKAA